MAVETVAAPPARTPSREEPADAADRSEELALVEEAGVPAEGIRAGAARFGREKVETAVAARVWRAHRLPERSCRAIARRAVADALGEAHAAAVEAKRGAVAGMGLGIALMAAVNPRVAADMLEELRRDQSHLDDLARQLAAARAEAAKDAIREQMAANRARATKPPVATPATRSQVGTAHRATRAGRTRTARRAAAAAASRSGGDSGDDGSGESDEPPERPGANGGRRSPRGVERPQDSLHGALGLIEELCRPGCDGRIVKREAARRGISEWSLRLARQRLGIICDRRGRRADHRCTWVRLQVPEHEARPRFRPEDFVHPEAAAFLNRRDELLERWRNRGPGRGGAR